RGRLEATTDAHGDPALGKVQAVAGPRDVLHHLDRLERCRQCTRETGQAAPFRGWHCRSDQLDRGGHCFSPGEDWSARRRSPADLATGCNRHEPLTVAPMDAPTVPKALLAFAPRMLMAIRQTTMMSASITA